ncbi:MAG: hypothetical protein DMG28_00625, partial [Acidobacteria bacterium]
ERITLDTPRKETNLHAQITKVLPADHCDCDFACRLGERGLGATARRVCATRYSVQSFRERRTTGANTERANEAKRGETKLSELSERELYLLERLEQRLTDLEARVGDAVTDHSVHSAELPVPVTTARAASPDHAQPPQGTKTTADFFRETTFSFTLDGYYGYNFNRPAGRINLLRAYDVTSNSFSLNQAGLIIERAPNPTAGRRFGARVDLQYGQATETLQGSGANEPRPQTYRPIFQAYGTYVVPIGGGLTVDFGKWASALGFENNYTKDQMNYSRSYSYNFLPFYHFGVSRELHRGPGWGELLGDEWGKPERGLQRL